MSFVIYHAKTTVILSIYRNGFWQDATYKTEGAARAAFTRLVKTGKILYTEYNIDELINFYKNIEKTEIKYNLITGLPFVQSVNTPLCCDPSSETYHSM